MHVNKLMAVTLLGYVMITCDGFGIVMVINYVGHRIVNVRTVLKVRE